MNEQDSYNITFETYNNIAQIYADRFMDEPLYNDTYDFFCSVLPNNSAVVLEVGCGPGNITKYLLHKIPTLLITATDVSPNMLDIASKNNPAAKCLLLDCRNLSKLNTKYDAIVSGFCFPYLSKTDCEKFITDSAASLNPEGILYISMIEGDYSKSGFESGSNPQNKVYVYYHQRQAIETYLQENGFNILKTFSKQMENTSHVSSTHLIFVAQMRP